MTLQTKKRIISFFLGAIGGAIGMLAASCLGLVLLGEIIMVLIAIITDL